MTLAIALASCPVGEVDVEVKDADGHARADNVFCKGEVVKLKAKITCSKVLTTPTPTYQWSQPESATGQDLDYTTAATGAKNAEVCATGTLQDGGTFQYSGTNFFYAIEVNTEINNTTVTTDDMVRKKFKFPGLAEHRFTVNSQMKVVGSPPNNVTVTLYSPDNRLRFSNSQREQTFTVDKSGAWTAFYISGENESTAVGDAVIESHLGNSKTDPKCGTKPCTVFTFINSSIIATVGDPYIEGSNYFMPWPGAAVNFNANADLSPSGLNTASPQLATLNIAFAQNMANAEYYAIFDTPTISWFGFVTAGTIQKAPKKVRRSKFISAWTLDVATGTGPVYSSVNISGVSSPGTPISSSDSPRMLGSLPATTALVTPNGIVTFNNRDLAGIKADFRLWCVTYDTATDEVWPLAETSWSLNARDNESDTVTVGSSGIPHHLPVTTPPTVNTLLATPPIFNAPVPESGAKATFVNPNVNPQ